MPVSVLGPPLLPPGGRRRFPKVAAGPPWRSAALPCRAHVLSPESGPMRVPRATRKTQSRRLSQNSAREETRRPPWCLHTRAGRLCCPRSRPTSLGRPHGGSERGGQTPAACARSERAARPGGSTPSFPGSSRLPRPVVPELPAATTTGDGVPGVAGSLMLRKVSRWPRYKDRNKMTSRPRRPAGRTLRVRLGNTGILRAFSNV